MWGKNHPQPDNNFHETKQNLLRRREDNLPSQREAAIRDKSCFGPLETPHLTQELMVQNVPLSVNALDFTPTSCTDLSFTTSSVWLQELITVHEVSSSLPSWQIPPFPGALPWTALEDPKTKCCWSTSSAILAPRVLLLLLQQNTGQLLCSMTHIVPLHLFVRIFNPSAYGKCSWKGQVWKTFY